jgi:beta-glucosidase-like glycosyl hydrolase
MNKKSLLFVPVLSLCLASCGSSQKGQEMEDLTQFARETVLGMQGTDLTTPDTVAAEPKHYVGYGNPVGGLNCAPCTMGRHDVFRNYLPRIHNRSALKTAAVTCIL